MGKRVLIGYGVDVDAVSGWINTRDGTPANPTDISRGIFGATVGVDRILKLFERHGIKATWFVPGHSLESFPRQLAKVRDAGHEIGLHGYTHEFVSTLNAQQQRDVMARSIETLTVFNGKKPKGWTAPSWSTSPQTVELLEEFGIQYDHSFMHHDSQLYYLPHRPTCTETDVSQQASHWMTPMSTLQPSNVVCVPANWHLDDWPPFTLALKQPSTHGYVDTRVVEELWKDMFTYLYREHDEFCFTITIHPQVSGKPQILLMHERFIEWVNDNHEGVEWCTMEKMVEEFKDGRIQGATVEGGVEM